MSVDCQTHLVVSQVISGPNSGIRYIEPVVADAWRKWAIGTVYAGAGYDGEWVHQWLRTDLGTASLISAKIGRPTSKPTSGHYRRRMREDLDETDYGQRWQVETVFCMIKRNLGEAVNATSYWSQCKVLRVLAVTHNIIMLLRIKRRSTEHF